MSNLPSLVNITKNMLSMQLVSPRKLVEREQQPNLLKEEMKVLWIMVTSQERTKRKKLLKMKTKMSCWMRIRLLSFAKVASWSRNRLRRARKRKSQSLSCFNLLHNRQVEGMRKPSLSKQRKEKIRMEPK